MYKIVFKKSAAKEFLSIPSKIQDEIEESLIILSIWRTDLLDIKILYFNQKKKKDIDWEFENIV